MKQRRGKIDGLGKTDVINPVSDVINLVSESPVFAAWRRFLSDVHGQIQKASSGISPGNIY